MITVADLSLTNLKGLQNAAFKTVTPAGVVLPATGRLVAANGEYRLYYAINITCILANGTEIQQASGFIITKTAYNEKGNRRQAVEPLAFYQVEGMYSDVDLDFKESVVTAYNDTIEGEEVETTEEVERVPTRNEEGETVQEQRAREEEEARQREEDAVTPINEEKTIRDETETFTYPGASISRVISMRIIEVKTGTIAEPIVSYRVEQYNKTAAQFINTDRS